MRTQAPEVKQLVAHAFPGYAGKRFKIQPFEHPITATSYWSGGSRDYWAMVNIATGKGIALPENGTPFSNGGKAVRIETLPDGVALICHSMGPYERATIYLNPANIRADMLPAPVEMTREERIVLCATRCFKSSYAGIKNYRFSEATACTGISLADWETAKLSLIGRGLLNKAGAITDEGRNAIGDTRIESLKSELCTAQ